MAEIPYDLSKIIKAEQSAAKKGFLQNADA
jgi:hypothetical protein